MQMFCAIGHSNMTQEVNGHRVKSPQRVISENALYVPWTINFRMQKLRRFARKEINLRKNYAQNSAENFGLCWVCFEIFRFPRDIGLNTFCILKPSKHFLGSELTQTKDGK